MEIVAHKIIKRSLQKTFLLGLLVLVSTICQSEDQAQTRYGPVMLGDTLSNIAYTLFPESSLTREQIMWAIYNSNPDAFINNDINNIKQGVTLNIPGHNEISSTPPLAAKQNLDEHTNLTHKDVKKLNEKLKSAREDAESQRQERAKLKARLIEMEMEIQQLIEKNRKKDLEIQSLDEQIKQ